MKTQAQETHKFVRLGPFAGSRVLAVLVLALFCFAGGISAPAPVAASTTALVNTLPAAPTATCTQDYYGIQVCDSNGVKALVVDLNDSHVSVRTVLPNGPNGECNSVNGNPPDGSSNCPGNNQYPLEPLDSMVRRTGAVAGINADYFCCNGQTQGDHGAQGLTIRNGQRLDGASHGVIASADRSVNWPSLAVSVDKKVTIGIPGSNSTIENNKGGLYYNTVGGAPIIVSGGSAIVNACSVAPYTTYPGDTCSSTGQSAGGVSSNGKLVLATANVDANTLATRLVQDFSVTRAIKFDGGGSASLAWRDASGNVQKWSANDATSLRPIASALVIFSEKIPACPTGQFLAEYFNGRNFDARVLARCEGSINYDWGGGSPVSGVGADNFSVRWTGTLNFNAGSTTFIVRADDGVRLWVDGQLAIDQWKDQGPTEYRVARSLSAGSHTVRVDYYENGGGAVAQARWETAAPPPQTTCSVGQFLTEYFNGRNFESRVLARCEGGINYDWGGGSAVGGVGADNFSVRWAGTFSFNAGNTTFIVRADDGVRLWVDGQLAIDQWKDQGPTEYRVTRSLSAGNHTVRVDYYENGGGAVAQARWETASAPPPPSGNNCDGGTGVYLYENGNFGGACSKFTSNSPNPRSGWYIGNDTASSVRIVGSLQAVLCQHDDYQGTCETFTREDNDLSNNSIGNDSVSSLRVEPIAAPPPPPSNGRIVQLVNVNSGMAVDVNGASMSDGAPVIQWYVNGGNNQKWRMESTGDGFYKLVNVNSGKCLDATGGAADGASIVQWTCHSGDNQRWRFDDLGGGQNVLVVKANGATRVLDVPGGSKTGGQALITWQRNNNTNQRWSVR